MSLLRPPREQPIDASEEIISRALEGGEYLSSKGLLTGSSYDPSDHQWWAEMTSENIANYSDINSLEQHLQEKTYVQEELRNPTVDVDQTGNLVQKLAQAGIPDEWIQEEIVNRNIHPPTPLSEEVIEHVEDRLGMDADRLYELAEKVAEAESSSGKNLSSTTSTAKGMYHFLDATFPTAKTRLRNILAKEGKSLPARIQNAQSIMDLSDEDQKALFLAHLTEEKGSDARMREYLQGNTTGEYLYELDHHKRVGSKDEFGAAMQPTDPRYVPLDPSIQRNIDRVFRNP